MERKFRSTGWKVLLAVVVFSIVGIGTALVQENKSGDGQVVPDAEYTWNIPTGGSPAAHYVVEVLVNDIDTLLFDPVTTNFFTLPVTNMNKYQIRVAGVDADNHHGPFSIWSEAYSPDLGSPEPLPDK